MKNTIRSGGWMEMIIWISEGPNVKYATRNFTTALAVDMTLTLIHCLKATAPMNA